MKEDLTKNSVVTAQLTEDQKPQWIYFVDSMYFSQKGFASKEMAIEAGKKKLAEVLEEQKDL